MSIIDISRTLSSSIAVWPGDTAFSLQTNLARAEGASVNLTTLKLSTHTGSHADAPYHFRDDGLTMEAVDLSPYWGAALVVAVDKKEGPLSIADLSGHDLDGARRLLVRSAASEDDPRTFPKQFVYPSPDLADYLGDFGVVLYGSDAPSMDAVDSKSLPGHNALWRNGIAIIEGLDLSAVPPGRYEFVALPLPIAGGDGSPVRAALRPLGPS
jgi:arylformamidase